MSDQKELKHILKDFVPPKLHEKDPLKVILDNQKLFGKKWCNFDNLSPKEILYWTSEFALGLMDEMSEVLNWLPWKHWKSYKDFKFDEIEIRFELIDMLHFVCSSTLVWKLSDEDIKDVLKADVYDSLSTVMTRIKGQYMTTFGVDLPISVNLRTDATIRALAEMSRFNAILLYHKYDPHVNNPPCCVLQLWKPLLDLFIIWNMSAEEVYTYYMAKNKENFARQGRGY